MSETSHLHVIVRERKRQGENKRVVYSAAFCILDEGDVQQRQYVHAGEQRVVRRDT